jgi:hypothetical protein
MAKVLGHLKVKGTINDINYYVQNGIGVARKTGGGFTSEAIRNNPNMEVIRDSNTEFGNRARVQKVFRDSLGLFFGNQKNRQLHIRLTQLFTKLKDLDMLSAPGQRRVGVGLRTEEGIRLLTRFEFTPYPLVLGNAVFDDFNFSYSVGTLNAADFTFGNGATHVELQLGVIVMDFDTLEASLYTSELLTISKASPLPSLILAPTEIPAGKGMRIGVLFHRYVQQVNGVIYPLKGQAVFGLKILGITD